MLTALLMILNAPQAVMGPTGRCRSSAICIEDLDITKKEGGGKKKRERERKALLGTGS